MAIGDDRSFSYGLQWQSETCVWKEEARSSKLFKDSGKIKKSQRIVVFADIEL